MSVRDMQRLASLYAEEIGWRGQGIHQIHARGADKEATWWPAPQRQHYPAPLPAEGRSLKKWRLQARHRAALSRRVQPAPLPRCRKTTTTAILTIS